MKPEGILSARTIIRPMASRLWFQTLLYRHHPWCRPLRGRRRKLRRSELLVERIQLVFWSFKPPCVRIVVASNNQYRKAVKSELWDYIQKKESNLLLRR